MLTIGLTGGIASGKTMVSDLFAKLNVPIVDTDLISRRLLGPDQPGYKLVVEHFNGSVLDKDQLIDRRELRRLIFNNKAEKHWLEAALHPLIFQQSQLKIEQYKHAAYLIVVIPLLFEAGFQALVNHILVIDCRSDIQINRLIARDNIDLELARQMLTQQWTNEDRLKQADDVIDNNNGLESSLDQQVMNLHQKYLLLSA